MTSTPNKDPMELDLGFIDDASDIDESAIIGESQDITSEDILGDEEIFVAEEEIEDEPTISRLDGAVSVRNNPEVVNEAVNQASGSAKPDAVSNPAKQTPFRYESIDIELREAKHQEAREARQASASTILKYNSAIREPNGVVMYGEIAGVETEKGEVFWVCYDNDVTIRIPFSEAYVNPPANLNTNSNNRDIRQRRLQFMTKSMGAEIRFIPTELYRLTDGSFIAIASRRKAEAKRRMRYFGKNAPRKAYVGADVQGTILALGPHKAVINVCGLDIKVPNHALSHRYIPDVSQEFYAGQQIRMRIMNIKEGAPLPTMIISALPIELEKFRPNMRRVRYTHGMPPRYHGIVTSVRQEVRDDTVQIAGNIFLQGINVPAIFRLSRGLAEGLATGTHVTVECLGKTKSGNYVFVRPIAVNNRY